MKKKNYDIIISGAGYIGMSLACLLAKQNLKIAIIDNFPNNYYQKRYKKIKSVNSRSMLNHFAFHLSNPLTIFIRNFFLKFLTKNKRFLEYYLGKIYKN